jgi:hypothetical protein
MNAIIIVLLTILVSISILAYTDSSFAQSPIGTLNIEKNTYKIPFNEKIIL